MICLFPDHSDHNMVRTVSEITPIPFTVPCASPHIIPLNAVDYSLASSNCVKNGWEGTWRINFTHELASLSPDIKFIESRWDVLE